MTGIIKCVVCGKGTFVDYPGKDRCETHKRDAKLDSGNKEYTANRQGHRWSRPRTPNILTDCRKETTRSRAIPNPLRCPHCESTNVSDERGIDNDFTCDDCGNGFTIEYVVKKL